MTPPSRVLALGHLKPRSQVHKPRSHALKSLAFAFSTVVYNVYVAVEFELLCITRPFCDPEILRRVSK